MKKKSKKKSLKTPLSKIQFLLKKRKIILLCAVISLLIIVMDIVTYDWNTVLGLSLNKANLIMDSLFSLAISYLVTFVFYLMLVFQQEYVEYNRIFALSYRLNKSFEGISLTLGDIITIIERVSNNKEIEDNRDFYSLIKYRLIYNNVTSDVDMPCCKRVIKDAKNVNLILKKIENYYYILSSEALKIFDEIQDTHIFENVDEEEWFDLAISTFWNDLKNVNTHLNTIVKNNSNLWVVNID